MKKLILMGICCVASSCVKLKVKEYPIEVSIWSGKSGFSTEFDVDSVKDNFAYKNGRKIELKNIRHIKFK